MWDIVRFVLICIFEISIFYNFYSCRIRDIYVLSRVSETMKVKTGFTIWERGSILTKYVHESIALSAAMSVVKKYYYLNPKM